MRYWGKARALTRPAAHRKEGRKLYYHRASGCNHNTTVRRAHGRNRGRERQPRQPSGAAAEAVAVLARSPSHCKQVRRTPTRAGKRERERAVELCSEMGAFSAAVRPIFPIRAHSSRSRTPRLIAAPPFRALQRRAYTFAHSRLRELAPDDIWTSLSNV